MSMQEAQERFSEALTALGLTHKKGTDCDGTLAIYLFGASGRARVAFYDDCEEGDPPEPVAVASVQKGGERVFLDFDPRADLAPVIGWLMMGLL